MLSAAESSTLPRGFRFHCQDGDRPTTPEAHVEDLQQPSPPRQPKRKLKRRNNQANMSGPTEQFLASVAAADFPIPTIETPDDAEMVDVDRSATPLPLAGYLAPQPRGSPPKTPNPQIDTGVGMCSIRKRDWYNENDTPEEHSRPSSALSNPSDWSDDSYFGSHLSRPSEDGSCTSPDSDFAGPFSSFSSFSKGKAKEIYQPFVIDGSDHSEILNKLVRNKSRNDAVWTKDMNNHLWQVYMLYLQDPTVTPFRLGSSFVPPEGVVIRVAREAKRSWKGPKGKKTPRQERRQQTPDIGMGARSMESAGSPDTHSPHSGSLTPTAETVPKAYPKWPHSSAATRTHLREMCKHDSSGHRRRRFGQSRSPTPFTQHGQSKIKSRARTPNSCPHMFGTKDVALALATSSAPSMQPDGPLAKLADDSKKARDFGQSIHLDNPVRRLGSPFTARTYGPSTSKVFSSRRPSPPRTRSETVKEIQLRSPVSFDKPRSLNCTMKRRAQYALEDELSPTGGLSRTSILDDILFRNPNQVDERPKPQRRVRSRGFTLGDDLNVIPGSLFAPEPKPDTVDPVSSSFVLSADPPKFDLLGLPNPATRDTRRRLGSPFDESFTSGRNTFPRRMLSPASTFTDSASIDDVIGFYNGATIRRRHGPFATVGSRDHASEVAEGVAQGQTLQEKLKGLEGKLREFNGRRL